MHVPGIWSAYQTTKVTDSWKGNSCLEGLGEQAVEELGWSSGSVKNKGGGFPLYQSLWKEMVPVGFRRAWTLLVTCRFWNAEGRLCALWHTYSTFPGCHRNAGAGWEGWTGSQALSAVSVSFSLCQRRPVVSQCTPAVFATAQPRSSGSKVCWPWTLLWSLAPGKMAKQESQIEDQVPREFYLARHL